MPTQASRAGRFNGPLLACGGAALTVLILFFPLVVWKLDVGEFLYLVLGVILCVAILIVALILAALGRFRKALSIMAVVAVFGASSWLLLLSGHAIHTQELWLTQGRQYRAAVLAQPAPAHGQFRHIAWDGWGWGGQDTSVYLVFDPDDSLAAAARSGKPGIYPGLPCVFYRVRRLQAHWYSVEFYTTSLWTDCGFARGSAALSGAR
ncbi:MAG TPA: hypothetical protein VME68_15150 [Acidobacteriaceae bacterium]|nr:hypothetical protein [Acidobacteriaceae bacterium]